MMRAASSFVFTLFATHAVAFDYQLKAERIAEGSYVVQGKNEDFTPKNGGNLANAAFIVTGSGVLVIDVGPTKLYGEQLRALIAKTTAEPIVKVLLTHAHPDHMLGAQAFADVGITALPKTQTMAAQMAGPYIENMYRLALDAAKGTERAPVVDAHKHALKDDALIIGRHRFQLLANFGHTDSDLAVFDTTTDVLYAGDLVFHQRTPTTPHAELDDWHGALDSLGKISFKQLVPGHGPVSTDARPITQTRAYLRWLDATLKKAAAEGRDMSELLDTPLPASLAPMAVFRDEFARSLAHLYPKYEQATLKSLK